VVFHVQTEDSGVDNPHIFTHLFHGGVILSTRRLDYDAQAADEVVKALMQAQHRAVLKDLTRGSFNDKIDAYLVDHPDLLPADAPGDSERKPVPDPVPAAPVLLGASEPGPAPVASAEVTAQQAFKSSISEALRAVDLVGREGRPTVPPAVAAAPIAAPPRQGPTESAAPRAAAAPAAANGGGSTPAAAGAAAAARSKAGRTAPPPARAAEVRSGVVVSRPAVIIGAPPRIVGDAAAAPRPASQPPSSRPARRGREEDARGDGLFGQDLISEKSLDEVILAYLSEDAPGD
jgi:hypothetical protein